MMKKLRFPLILLLFVLLPLSITACGGRAYATSSWPGVTIGEDTAYVAYNQFVYAIQTGNGALVWQYPEKGNAQINFFADPILTGDGQLLAGGFNNILYSLDAATGVERWKFEGAGGRYIGSPLALESGIYAPNADGSLYALDTNGRLLWEFETGAALWAQPVYNKDCGCLFLSSMDHSVYAVATENGQMIWESDLGSSIVGSPAMSEDGFLYVGTFGAELLALNADSGAVAWRTPTTGWIWGGPAIDGDRLFVGDMEGNFYGVNRADGSIVWKIQPDGSVTGTPVVRDGVIYATTENGSLYAIDTQGQVLWNQVIGGELLASPELAGDTIYAAPIETEEMLVALNSNGVRKWAFPPPE